MQNQNTFTVITETSDAKSETDKLKQHNCEHESLCHKKIIPLWLVFLDNLPTLSLIILGTLIILKLSVLAAIGFIAYSVFSIVWFWAKICPFCHHYNTYACPCGYGIISARLFRKRNDKSFIKVFRNNIVIMFPVWFVPVLVAGYLLIFLYNIEVLVLTIAFSIVGFLIIPLISKFVGCKNCEIKEECPWMQKK